MRQPSDQPLVERQLSRQSGELMVGVQPSPARLWQVGQLRGSATGNAAGGLQPGVIAVRVGADLVAYDDAR